MEERKRKQRGVYRREEDILNEYMEEKKRKKKVEEEQELRNLKGETEVWTYINKRRGRKEGAENNISKEERKEYFIKLLKGIEGEERKEKIQEKKTEIGKREEEKKS